MFRRLSSSLPEDPEFPADLEKLGFVITFLTLLEPNTELN